MTGIILVGFGLTILPACSDDGGSGDDSSTESAEPTGDLSAEDQEKVDAAEAWIDDEADLDDDLRAELVFTDLSSTPAVTNVTFGQVIDDHPVQGAELVVHVLDDDSVQGATNALTDAEPVAVDDPIDEDEAEENAGKAVEGTPDEVGPSELTWVGNGPDLMLAWAVPVTATDPGVGVPARSVERQAGCRHGPARLRPGPGRWRRL